MEELKRCPFCGCRSVGVGYIANRSVYYITCANCEATGPEEPTKGHAVRKWNRVSEKVYENHGNDRLVTALERIATALESQTGESDTPPTPPDQVKTPEWTGKMTF